MRKELGREVLFLMQQFWMLGSPRGWDHKEAPGVWPLPKQHLLLPQVDTEIEDLTKNGIFYLPSNIIQPA